MTADIPKLPVQRAKTPQRGMPMKNQLSTNATVYANENSCLEDVLAIADEIRLKARKLNKLSAANRAKPSSAGNQQLASAGGRRATR